MKVLVVVDMQNDFIDGSLANIKGSDVLNAVIKEIKKDYDYYFLTRDSHPSNYLDTYEGINLPVEHCIKGTPGWEINSDILKELDNKKYKIFDKDGFGSYELIEELETYKDKIEDITIVGLCSDICVITSSLMLRAKFNNIPIYYVPDAMFATTKENQDAAIKILNACQIYEKKK